MGRTVYAPTAEDEKLTGPWRVSLLHANGTVQLSCPHCEFGSGGVFDPSVLVVIPTEHTPATEVSSDQLAALLDRSDARTQFGRDLANDEARAHRALCGMVNELLARRARK